MSKKSKQPRYKRNMADWPTVDADLFLWCFNVYQAAAMGTMQVDVPQSPVIRMGGKDYALADTPTARGGAAIGRELRERGLNDEARMAFMARISYIDEIIAAPECAEFVRFTGETAAGAKLAEINTCLVRACASARLYATREAHRFDLEDVLRIARDLAAKEEGANLEH